ncbi:MAG: nuclear transport factor 2 family protein [Candidatus Lokiarchaeota archaeon]|nr:nuclear transport factor 2 family protein [Candidatus Lokiarchaeota archaeon]MBD3337745.1 nuclear transport factor 2 family protein [Candidatus Lokiarchaeota archaeon]
MENRKLDKFCRVWLNAWTGNDPEELIRFYGEDGYYQDPANPEGIRGSSDMLNYFRKLLAKNPDWRWKLDELYPTPKGFVLKWYANIPVGNDLVNAKGMDIVELRGDKITRNEVYFDRTPLFEKMGLLKGK